MTKEKILFFRRNYALGFGHPALSLKVKCVEIFNIIINVFYARMYRDRSKQ